MSIYFYNVYCIVLFYKSLLCIAFDLRPWNLWSMDLLKIMDCFKQKSGIPKGNLYNKNMYHLMIILGTKFWDKVVILSSLFFLTKNRRGKKRISSKTGFQLVFEVQKIIYQLSNTFWKSFRFFSLFSILWWSFLKYKFIFIQW